MELPLAAHGDIGFLLWGDVMLWYFVFVFLYMGALELLFSILEKIRRKYGCGSSAIVLDAFQYMDRHYLHWFLRNTIYYSFLGSL